MIVCVGVEGLADFNLLRAEQHAYNFSSDIFNFKSVHEISLFEISFW